MDPRAGILTQVSAGVVAVDRAGRIVEMNPAAEALVGWRAEEARGQASEQILRFSEGLAALAKPEEEDPSDAAIKPEPINIGGHLHSRSGVILPVLVQQLPWINGQEWLGYVFTIHDMSAFHDQLRLREELLSNIAHEFRTPLASLVASIEMLDSEHHQMSEEEIDQLLGSLHRTVRRMESLVNNILDEASLRAGRLQIRTEPVDLLDIIEGGVLFIQPMLDQRRQRLEIHLPEMLEAVRADEQRISQVLINLLDNASKYSPPGSTITLTAQDEEKMIRVTVQDHGPGIPRERQDDLFKRFSRLTKPAAEETSGTGLGLAIAKAIVERHGGKIGLESESGVGTQVWFTLPRA